MIDKIEQYRKILADAPEGATHPEILEKSLGYRKLLSKPFMDFDESHWEEDWCIYGDIHSMRDIQTIVDQYDENQLLKSRVAELEKERDEILDNANETIIGGITDEKVNAWLSKRDIEQQIKGIESLYEWFRETHTNENDRGSRYMAFVKQLRQQAKGE